MKWLFVTSIVLTTAACTAPQERYTRLPSATLPFDQAYGQCEAQGYTAGAPISDPVMASFTRGRVRDACMRGHGYPPRH